MSSTVIRDVALVRYRADRYRTGHPRAADTLLVIEVADTSVESDRQRKPARRPGRHP